MNSPKQNVIATFLIGLAICIAIMAVDQFALSFVSVRDGIGWLVLTVFGIYIVQTACLGAFVGYKSRQSNAWWLFLGWTLLLVNLQLNLVQLQTYFGNRDLGSLFFAFFAAQIGMVVFWAVLGSEAWKARLPASSVLLVITTYPLWLNVGGRNWWGILIGYIVACFITCLILRRMRFRVGNGDRLTDGTIESGNTGQFTVTHLFIWTTVVGLMFGVGRFVPWAYISDQFLNEESVGVLSRSSVITISTATTLWAVMGRKQNMWLRIVGLIFVLLGVGIALFYMDRSFGKGGIARWGKTTEEQLVTWLSWSVLNGLFLGGLLLAFRVKGIQLIRLQKKNRSSKQIRDA